MVWREGAYPALSRSRRGNPPQLTAAGREAGRLAFVQANYVDIPSEIYMLPLQIATAEEGKRALTDTGQSAIARLHHADGECIELY